MGGDFQCDRGRFVGASLQEPNLGNPPHEFFRGSKATPDVFKRGGHSPEMGIISQGYPTQTPKNPRAKEDKKTRNKSISHNSGTLTPA